MAIKPTKDQTWWLIGNIDRTIEVAFESSFYVSSMVTSTFKYISYVQIYFKTQYIDYGSGESVWK